VIAMDTGIVIYKYFHKVPHENITTCQTMLTVCLPFKSQIITILFHCQSRPLCYPRVTVHSRLCVNYVLSSE